MKIFRVSIVVLFIATFSNAAFAHNDKRKDGTKGTVAEPECEFSIGR